MSDRLLYVALLLSVFGLALLVFVSARIEPPYIEVSDVDTSLLEKNVHLRGNISEVHEFKGGSVLLTLSEDNATVDLYLSRSVASGFDAKKLRGAKVDVIGMVQLYESKLEVVVSKAENMRVL